MTVSPLAPELVYIILGSLPLSNMPDRTQTLINCSLVNSTFRQVAQRELGKHIHWLSLSPNRVANFVRSPSCPEHWAPGSIWLREASAADVFALLGRASSVQHLSLFLTRQEDRESRVYDRVPDEAVKCLSALESLTLGRIQINLENASLSNLHTLNLTAGSFSPTTHTPSLLAAAPNLHTLTLDLSSSAALATLPTLRPSSLTSLRTLHITDAFVDELPPLPSIPQEQLAFTRALPGLARLRHNWLYPAHVEQVLGALPEGGTLRELEVKVFVDGEEGEGEVRLGRVLREAGERGEVKRLKRWVVATMDPGRNQAVGEGWLDEDCEEWRKGCQERGTEVVLVRG